MTDYFNICNESEATHYLEDGVLNPVKVARKIVDLSPLAGNTEILFEFSDGGSWYEGYLGKIHNDSSYRYSQYCKENGKLPREEDNWVKCRFQTDRWYYHDGKSECPIPEGVIIEFHVINRGKGGEHFICKLSDKRISHKRSFDVWIHRDGYIKVVAYRILGLKDGYKYEWEED